MIEAIVYQKFICMVSIFSLVCNWITASPSDALGAGTTYYVDSTGEMTGITAQVRTLRGDR